MTESAHTEVRLLAMTAGPPLPTMRSGAAGDESTLLIAFHAPPASAQPEAPIGPHASGPHGPHVLQSIPIGCRASFRHTFSSLLHKTGTSLAAQKEPLRHAGIQTAMNIYTQAVSAEKREAVQQVVKTLLNA